MHMTAVNANSVPAFLTKLWRLVEDNNYDELICWSSGGTTFFIRNQSRFSKELLPLYFKHGNMASFVRQLNMYGFRKVVSIEQGGLRSEKDEIEFQHMYFLKGHEYLLELIKRKIPTTKGTQEEVKLRPELVSKMLVDVKHLFGKQESLDGKLSNLKSENEVLWREVANLREQHKKQQQIVNKLIHFLLSLVHHNHRLGVRRKIPLMLDDMSHSPAKSPRYGRSFSMESGKGSRIESDVQSSGTLITDVMSPSGPVIRDITDSFDTEAFLMGEVDAVPTVTADSPSFLTKSEDENPVVAGTSNCEESNLEPSSKVDQPQQNTEDSNNLVDLIQVINANDVAAPTSVARDDGPTQIVPVVDKDLDKVEFADHLDNLQLELDALKDILSENGCTIDPTALLGVCPSPTSILQLFSTDDGKSIIDSIVDYSGRSTSHRNEIVGTELTQYNPSSVLNFLDEDEHIFDADSILPNVDGDNCLNNSLFECINAVETDDKPDPDAVELSLPDASNEDASLFTDSALPTVAQLSPLTACTAEIFSSTVNGTCES